MSMAIRTSAPGSHAGDRAPRRSVDHNDRHAPRAQDRRGVHAVPALPVADRLTTEGRRRCARRLRSAGRLTGMAHWALVLGAAAVLVYAAFVAALALAGRRGDARAVAGFIPDCIVLLHRLLGD